MASERLKRVKRLGIYLGLVADPAKRDQPGTWESMSVRQRAVDGAIVGVVTIAVTKVADAVTGSFLGQIGAMVAFFAVVWLGVSGVERWGRRSARDEDGEP